MSALLLPDIAGGGFGKEHRQGRKPLKNLYSTVAIAHIADKRSIEFDLYRKKGNRHTQYARVEHIGKIGKWATGKRRYPCERKS